MLFGNSAFLCLTVAEFLPETVTVPTFMYPPHPGGCYCGSPYGTDLIAYTAPYFPFLAAQTALMSLASQSLTWMMLSLALLALGSPQAPAVPPRGAGSAAAAPRCSGKRQGAVR